MEIESDNESLDFIELVPLQNAEFQGEDLNDDASSIASSSFTDNECLELDSVNEIDLKMYYVGEVNNIKFINYESRNPICVTQNYFLTERKKLCIVCFYDVMEPITENIRPQFVTAHFTGPIGSLHDSCFNCYACNKELFMICLVHLCHLCNNQNFNVTTLDSNELDN